MRDVLDVPRYLAVQGFRYEGDGSRDEALRDRLAVRRPAAQYLAEHAAQLGRFIGALNGLSSQALEQDVLARPVQRFNDVPPGRWVEALRTLQHAKVLQWSGQAQIAFPDAEAARFCGGGWLEEYAYAIAKDVGMYDVRFNVQGTWEGAEHARNEFDVLACDRNRLLFIECKTLRWNEDERRNDNELAYKIESLGKDVRGLFGASWLVTARRPTPVLEARARQAKFRLIEPHELRDLRDRLQAWKGGRSG
ncbi:Card1-like endonuclease domain-containing protein [Nitrospira sp. Kam-Ns4a]